MKTVHRADVKIGFRCNNMCLFCVQGDKRKQLGQKDKQLVFKELRTGRQKQCDSVVFTGGEPTLNNALIEFVKYAKRMGYSSIQIQTNGRMFEYPDYCKKIIEAGANEFSPALHGSSAKIHDSLTRSHGSFMQTVKGIKNLKSLGQKVITNTVITKQNYKDLPNLARLFVKLKVDQFQFAFPHIVGSAMENKEQIIQTMSEALPFVKKGLDVGKKHGIRAMTEAIPYCFMRGYEECIAERVMPNAIVFDGNYTIKNYEKYRVNHGKVKSAKCQTCAMYSYCEGPWREYPEMFGWKEFAPVSKEHTTEDFEVYKKFVKTAMPLHNVFFLPSLLHRAGAVEHFICAKEIKAAWQKYLRNSKKIGDAPRTAHCYIHIPFCKTKCEYCMYFKKIASNAEINRYLERLAGQCAYFSGVFSGHPFQSLYIGGGTPSILSEKQLAILLKNIFSRFSFVETGEKSFECNPASITENKLRILKRYGFNRISFGVQNAYLSVLKNANRGYQTLPLVKKAVDLAHAHGYEVNTDIMMGIKGDSPDSVAKSFRILARLHPDTIMVYPFKPTEEYLEKYCGNDYVSFHKKLLREVKLARKKLTAECKKSGYWRVDRGHEIETSVEPTFYRNGYKTPLSTHYDAVAPLNYRHPQSLFALGAHATAHIVGNMHYHDAKEELAHGAFDPSAKDYWSFAASAKDDMRHYVLHQYSSLRGLSQKNFFEYFGISIKKVFGSEILLLKKIGKMKEKGDLLFLPDDELERYACALYFLNKQDILRRMPQLSFGTVPKG